MSRSMESEESKKERKNNSISLYYDGKNGGYAYQKESVALAYRVAPFLPPLEARFHSQEQVVRVYKK
jgi:hypothetical protein